MLRTIVLGMSLVLCAGVDAAPKKAAAKAHSSRNRMREQKDHQRVLQAQVLLDRAGLSVGEIDGSEGANFKRAVQGFQKKNQLHENGELDTATWEALTRDSSPALVPHTISADEIAGPFEKIPADMMEQSKLKALSYETPQEELGERFHCSPALLAKLNPGKDLTRVGEEIQVPNIRTPLTGKPAQVVVSKSAMTVTALDDAGNIISQYPATIGSEHDPLPIGDWKVTVVQRNPVFHYNPDLFWDADPTHSKANIPAGPNNPVGLVWIGLTKEHYGIHGTPKPDQIGHTESHGCIRLTNWDALELAGMVTKGTPVRLTE